MTGQARHILAVRTVWLFSISLKHRHEGDEIRPLHSGKDILSRHPIFWAHLHLDKIAPFVKQAFMETGMRIVVITSMDRAEL